MTTDIRARRECAGMRHRARGYTLIELMIVVVVIGILSLIAYPAYTSYVQKSRRTDATNALTGTAAALEQYFSQHQTYANATLGSGSTSVYPATSTQGYYSLALTLGSTNPCSSSAATGSCTTATCYTVSAAPVAGGVQAGDTCGTFTLDSLGNKCVSQGQAYVSTCWGSN